MSHRDLPGGELLAPDLQALLNASDQLVTRPAVLALGVSDAELGRAVRAGALVRVRRGAYTSPEYWQAQTRPEHRELLRARAASTLMHRPHLLSHDSAAHALGLRFLMPENPLVHVARPGVIGSRTRDGVNHHAADFTMPEVTITRWGPVLGAARTAVDLTRQHGFRVGVTACDAALRLGIPRGELERVAAAMPYWRGITQVRRAVAFADAGAENPAESLTRVLVSECGAGDPVTQYPLPLPQGVAWADVRIGRQVVEFDGRLKYRRRSEGGVAEVDAGDVVWRERQRERAILDLGLGVSRVIWNDLLPGNWARTRERLRSEIAQTHARFGSTVPAQLAQFAASMARERDRRIPSAPAP